MSKLKKLQEVYPKAKYEPLEGCEKCNGTGEVKLTKEKKKKFTVLVPPEKSPCMCIYVSPKFLGIARKTLGSTIKKLKSEIQ